MAGQFRGGTYTTQSTLPLWGTHLPVDSGNPEQTFFQLVQYHTMEVNYATYSVSEIAHFYTYTYFFECTLRKNG